MIDLAMVYDDFACEIGCDVDFSAIDSFDFSTIFEPLLVTITSPKLFLDMVRRTASRLSIFSIMADFIKFAFRDNDNQGASICRTSFKLLPPIWFKRQETFGDFAYCN